MTAANTQFGLSRIGQIAVNARDLPRATAFYRDVLGMSMLFEAPSMAFFACGDVRLMLGTAERPDLDHPGSIIYYTVDDIQDAAGTLRTRGVRFEHEPRVVHRTERTELWMAFLYDSEDNLLALMSEVPVA